MDQSFLFYFLGCRQQKRTFSLLILLINSAEEYSSVTKPVWFFYKNTAWHICCAVLGIFNLKHALRTAVECEACSLFTSFSFCSQCTCNFNCFDFKPLQQLHPLYVCPVNGTDWQLLQHRPPPIPVLSCALALAVQLNKESGIHTLQTTKFIVIQANALLEFVI